MKGCRKWFFYTYCSYQMYWTVQLLRVSLHQRLDAVVKKKNLTPRDRTRDLAHQKVSSDHSAAVGGGEHFVTIINIFLLSLNVSFTFRFLLFGGTSPRVKMTQLCRELSISKFYNFFYSVVLIKLHTRVCWWCFKLRFTNDETYWSTCLSTEKSLIRAIHENEQSLFTSVTVGFL